MVTLLGALLGFFGSAFPEVLKIFSECADRKHELEILHLQMKQKQQGHHHKLEEINAQADIAESKALYKTYNTGIKWVDALNGTVRPVLAYAFFMLYAGVKMAQFYAVSLSPMQAIVYIWTIEDQAIFAGIISFYFGQRSLHKIRAGR